MRFVVSPFLPWCRTFLAAAFCLIVAACGSSPRDVASSRPTAQRPPVVAQSQGPTSTLDGAQAGRSLLPPNQLIPGIAPPAPGQAPITVRPATDPLGLVRIGLLVPLTGPSASTGQALLNAAQMALFDIADERFVLQVYDSKGTAEGADAAAAMAISHGVQLILGPLFSAEAKAIAPRAAAAGVNIITFSTDPTVAGPHVFVLGFLVQEQVRQIVGYARDQGLSRFAVLAPNTAYGQAVVEAFRRYVPARGGKVAQVAFYEPDGGNLNEVVRNLATYEQRKRLLEQQRAELAGKDDEISQAALKRLERLETTGDVDFDTILIPEQGSRLTQAATLLPFFDVDSGRVQLLGTMLWDAPGLGREPVMVGGVFPAPPPESNKQFFSRYREFYGRAAPTIASHGYDSIALAAILARSGEANAFSAEALTSASGFAGVDGIFRFTHDGMSQRGFAIMQVTRDGTTVAAPAPSEFPANQF